QGELAQDPALAGAGQRVLEVDRGERDLDHDLARREVVDRQLLQAAAVAGVVIVDAECGEARGHSHLASVVPARPLRRLPALSPSCPPDGRGATAAARTASRPRQTNPGAPCGRTRRHVPGTYRSSLRRFSSSHFVALAGSYSRIQ